MYSPRHSNGALRAVERVDSDSVEAFSLSPQAESQ